MAHGHKWWGNQSYQIGFYEYGLSPHQLKLFKGYFNPGFSKFIKRSSGQLAYIIPPFLVYYFVREWADKKYEYYSRKEYLLTHDSHHH